MTACAVVPAAGTAADRVARFAGGRAGSSVTAMARRRSHPDLPAGPSPIRTIRSAVPATSSPKLPPASAHRSPRRLVVAERGGARHQEQTRLPLGTGDVQQHVVRAAQTSRKRALGKATRPKAASAPQSNSLRFGSRHKSPVYDSPGEGIRTIRCSPIFTEEWCDWPSWFPTAQGKRPTYGGGRGRIG